PDNFAASSRFRSSAPVSRRRGADAAQARRVLANRECGQRRLRPAGVAGRVIRICRVIGIASPLAAVAAVIVAGALTPGYDAMSRTVSRLAVPGVWAAAVVDVSISLIALTCFALALTLSPNVLAGRVALTVSGVALGGAAMVHSTEEIISANTAILSRSGS